MDETCTTEEELRFWQRLNEAKCESDSGVDFASWREADVDDYD